MPKSSFIEKVLEADSKHFYFQVDTDTDSAFLSEVSFFIDRKNLAKCLSNTSRNLSLSFRIHSLLNVHLYKI